ncbi:MAG: hypothetical protein H6718_00640 [Polyangiaceae bacterium]|nr:hypothetical protein [Myxococcales bacterium]MCB9583870.1 hypothetical protein [Polyangiaceae bacterium]MCB9607874.1 hypothetical protein [Polyangiaceae bacterium]
MSGAWVLVWLGASAPTLDQRLAIESYELTHGIATRAPAAAPQSSVPYPAAVAKRVESGLETIRTLVGSLQDEEAKRALKQTKSLLRKHPELPQAPWLMAECLRLEARLQSRTPDSTETVWKLLLDANNLGGGRATGFDEAGIAEVSGELPWSARVRFDVPRGTRLDIDGTRVEGDARGSILSSGAHHVRLSRDGRHLYAAWLEVDDKTRQIPLPVPETERCTQADFVSARNQPEARKFESVSCDRWLMARPAPGPTRAGQIQVRSCEGELCSGWLVWKADLRPDFAGPPQVFDHDAGWPDWATYVIVGASALAVTGVVLWQLGTFDSAEPGKQKWVYEPPAALTF